MQAVILAAGEGKRLRPLTNDVPKPMVELDRRPILEYTLSILPKQIDEVILVTGYKGEKIKERFGVDFGRLKLRYAEQKKAKGTGSALRAAKPLLRNGHFLLLHGDDLYHPDDLQNCLQDMPIVLTKESAHPERFGVCIIGENNRLIDIIEKPQNPPGNLVNVGVYLLTQDIFSIPPCYLPNGESNLAAQIGALAQKRPIHAIKARFWHPIGYPEDIELGRYFVSLPAEERLN
jgi:bifunctional UDP-N-acetylglucosamine pyrophosphorylase/glucosamine-1-phosphate N-acetyltransferase